MGAPVPYPAPVRSQLRLVGAVSAVLATALVLAIVLGAGHGGSSRPSAGQSASFDGAAFPAGLRAKNFALTDQYGRNVSLSAYRGRVVALAFLSPGCRTCALVAQQVRGALDELESHPPAKPGVKVVFVSTDPEAPHARVGGFLNEASLSGRVEYLTGSPAQLRPVWHAYGVPPPSASKTASEAAVMVILIDRSGAERVGFGVEQVTPESLTHDIRLLEAE
jgi:cytochrome oxidase Cu insertion factor (SCO1/SenC/PrrC family)